MIANNIKLNRTGNCINLFTWYSVIWLFFFSRSFPSRHTFLLIFRIFVFFCFFSSAFHSCRSLLSKFPPLKSQKLMLNLVKTRMVGFLLRIYVWIIPKWFFFRDTPSYIKHSTIHVAFLKPVINRNCCLQLSALSMPVKAWARITSSVGCRCTCNMFMYFSVAR